jgi:hypothetical protein
MKLTKEQFNRLFFGLHGVERRHAPNDHSSQSSEADCATGERGPRGRAAARTVTTAIAATHQNAKLFAPFVQQVVEFGNLVPARRTPRTVVSVIVVVSARAASVSAAAPWATVIPSHEPLYIPM